MLQGEHSAILLTFIKLQFVIKVIVLSSFEWPFYTGLTVDYILRHSLQVLRFKFQKFRILIILNSPDND